MPPLTTPALVSGGGLFVDYKKGEIPELKNLLRDSAVDKDPKTKRALMERVVGYMTLGTTCNHAPVAAAATAFARQLLFAAAVMPIMACRVCLQGVCGCLFSVGRR